MDSLLASMDHMDGGGDWGAWGSELNLVGGPKGASEEWMGLDVDTKSRRFATPATLSLRLHRPPPNTHIHTPLLFSFVICCSRFLRLRWTSLHACVIGWAEYEAGLRGRAGTGKKINPSNHEAQRAQLRASWGRTKYSPIERKSHATPSVNKCALNALGRHKSSAAVPGAATGDNNQAYQYRSTLAMLLKVCLSFSFCLLIRFSYFFICAEFCICGQHRHQWSHSFDACRSVQSSRRLYAVITSRSRHTQLRS